MKKRLVTVIAFSALLLLSACSGTYSRGQFGGFVLGATEQQIVDRVGKPDEVQVTASNRQAWVYKKRTFDPENMNQVDIRTTVIVERDGQGQLVGRDVLYG